MQTGTVILKNAKQYPFNDSEMIVELPMEAANSEYFVQTEIVRVEEGDIGDIVIDGKARNGFRLAFTGSAREAEIRYLLLEPDNASEPGQTRRRSEQPKLAYTIESNVLKFEMQADENNNLTIDLAEAQRGYAYRICISEDASGRLVRGEGMRYLAEVQVPARVHEIYGKGYADDMGIEQVGRRTLPLDPADVRVTLWPKDGKKEAR